MNGNRIRFRVHTKAFFVSGLVLLATAFLDVFIDFALHGIHIFPSVQQMEQGRKVTAIFCSLLALGFLVEFVGLVCFVLDNPQRKPPPPMRERL